MLSSVRVRVIFLGQKLGWALRLTMLAGVVMLQTPSHAAVSLATLTFDFSAVTSLKEQGVTTYTVGFSGSANGGSYDHFIDGATEADTTFDQPDLSISHNGLALNAHAQKTGLTMTLSGSSSNTYNPLMGPSIGLNNNTLTYGNAIFFYEKGSSLGSIVIPYTAKLHTAASGGNASVRISLASNGFDVDGFSEYTDSSFSSVAGSNDGIFSGTLTVNTSSAGGQIAIFSDVSTSTNMVTPVPEPEVYAMMLPGLTLLCSLMYRRKKKMN